jgi:hypothetical protein
MLSPQDGYLFVPDDADDVTATAAAGVTLRLPTRTPPWIIVDRAIETVVVARWPGRLWQVETIDAEGIEQPSPPAPYSRAAAVRVVAELPAWRLFGERGQSVAAVIAAASRVEVEDVETLALSRDPDAGRAYARAWKRWLTSIGVNVARVGDDLDGTLAIPVNGRQSPINYGFSVISRALEERADSLVGDAAFVTSDDGERWLERTWSAAACALLEAAMSFGAPEASRDDAPTLAAAFRAAVERQ